MRASRKVSRWTRTWGLTFVSIGIFHFFPVQAQQETLTDKTGRGDDSQDHNPKHHHYKLEVIPSLGGLLTNFYHPENNIAVLNRQGAASGGSADTLLPERFLLLHTSHAISAEFLISPKKMLDTRAWIA